MPRTDTARRARRGVLLSLGIPGLGHAYLRTWKHTLWWGLLVPVLGNLVAAGIAYPTQLTAFVDQVTGSGSVTGSPNPLLLLVPGRPLVLFVTAMLESWPSVGSGVDARLEIAAITAMAVAIIIRLFAARSAARLAYRQYWMLRRRALQQRLLAQLADRYDFDLPLVPIGMLSPNAPYDDLRTANLLSVQELVQVLSAVAAEAQRAGDDALVHAVSRHPADPIQPIDTNPRRGDESRAD